MKTGVRQCLIEDNKTDLNFSFCTIPASKYKELYCCDSYNLFFECNMWQLALV